MIKETGRLIFKSASREETIRFGERLGRLLAPGQIVALVGELGAGKTTLVKGIVKGLDFKESRVVKSPTFALVHRYEGRIPVYHFDAYRLKDAQEMFDIGSDEMLFGEGVSLVEWADKVFECLPDEYMKITLTATSLNERTIEICSYGVCYDDLMNKLVIHD
ncbi:MAG: tRNA (adenosine(37)-N6)-threonylcarbamoyltransferase complex ATPase subunit type 1 TsaE [Planctomycetes bacterium RBG_16_41_13]|nr:MAG: tRNA (adenosine(37)-N6)-threonylcarbamoyltransferase complex ATPase subunit type 1 TsaE [Planctomycetes bacterium RBG_16_41_13]